MGSTTCLSFFDGAPVPLEREGEKARETGQEKMQADSSTHLGKIPYTTFRECPGELAFVQPCCQSHNSDRPHSTPEKERAPGSLLKSLASSSRCCCSKYRLQSFKSLKPFLGPVAGQGKHRNSDHGQLSLVLLPSALY